MSEQREITYKQEILRKGIHLLSLSIPIIYSYMDKITGLKLLIPITLFFLLGDIISHRSGLVRSIVLRYFGSMMREHELRSDRLLLNGASYVLLAACLCVIVFPKIIGITAFSILIISDICAALFGRQFGKHKFLDKSLEGTSAFIISAVGVVLFLSWQFNAPYHFIIAGTLAAFVGGIIENISIRLRMDDNFSIPASVGATMWLYAVLVPNAISMTLYYRFMLKILAVLMIIAGIGLWLTLPSESGCAFELIDSYIDTTQPPQPRLLNKNGQPSIQMIPQRFVQLFVSTTTTDSTKMIDVGNKYVEYYNKKLGGDSVIIQTIVLFIHPDSVRQYTPQEYRMITSQAPPAFHAIIQKMRMVDNSTMYAGFSPMLRFIAEEQQKIPQYIFNQNRPLQLPEPGFYKYAMLQKDINTIKEQQQKQQPKR